MRKISFLLGLILFSVSAFGQVKTGTLKIFSELSGIVVYLDENRQGDDIQQINDVPVGTHYLKVLKDGVNVFGELISIQENTVTTVLIKNTGQVQEKILDSKTAEQQEYQNGKLDILLTSGSVTTTQGASTLFPGYYSYWGYSKSVSQTSQVTDWKIIQGGVKEISEYQMANLTGNNGVLQAMANAQRKQTKMATTGAMMFLSGLVVTGVLFWDMLGKKPFLHPDGTTAPNWEVGVATGAIVTGALGYGIAMASDKNMPAHYYNVDEAAKEAQNYNLSLKKKLGLPDNYDTR